MGIQLKNVVYSYQGKYQSVRAVDGVSYDFEPGKFYAIIGASGSGKTTLLSLMAGLDLPTGGEILIEGKSTREWNRNQLRRNVISVIYQNYNLFPLLTVKENIQYPLTLKKARKKDMEEIAKSVREKVGLPESYDKRLPSRLSGGEQQRVAIARALAQGSRIILGDEPTGNLDTVNTRNVVGILKALAASENCTVIVVTHDPSVAAQADVVLRMKDGKWTEEKIELTGQDTLSREDIGVLDALWKAGAPVPEQKLSCQPSVVKHLISAGFVREEGEGALVPAVTRPGLIVSQTQRLTEHASSPEALLEAANAILSAPGWDAAALAALEKTLKEKEESQPIASR